ncbi:hypothetical protein LUZ60_000559 [Juncus effusus]|nr:hypothetical protein LUZ60_000559 [Juncus effusus]
MATELLEITLISAQGLKMPPGFRRIQTYAVIWVDQLYKLRTRTDRTGGPDPAWNDRFVFRVPTEYLVPDSSSAVSIEIYCTGGWYGKESLVGSVRFLIGNERLLGKPPNSPSFAALGIRRPSGRITGVLNIGAVLLSNVSRTVTEALVQSPAVSYRDLNLLQRPAMRDRTNTEERETGTAERREKAVPVLAEEDEEEEEEREDLVRGVVFCGPCLLRVPRKIHLSPSDENFKVPVQTVPTVPVPARQVSGKKR